ncbi:MAG: ATP-grasp domain-containing protein [Candidatus Solibacter usitatus]|nr:ATP-grasp domain-containing protein [Candidatus Solibacter usitatus]
MAPRLLLLAATTGYSTRVFADQTRRLGYHLTLATDRCRVLDDPWGDHAFPVRFEQPEEAARQLAAAGPFDGILAVADRPAYVAALAAQKLGLRYHPPDAVAACHDKHLARERYRAAGLPTPDYFRVSLAEDPAAAACRAPYPCVLKPLGLSASRGVIRADGPEQFVSAFRRIAALLKEADILRLREAANSYIQVERFIPGVEYALEGVLTEGCLKVLAIFDKPDPLDGPFFEETIYVTPSRAPDAAQQALIAATEQGIRALGLWHGPIHAEMRRNQQGVWILEIAARPIGGLCAKALRFDPSMPLEELLLRHAVGQDVAAARLADPASGVMMIPIRKAGIYQGVDGVDRAARIAGEVIVTAKEGQELRPLPEGASYLGFIFARGASPLEVERLLRAAHAELRFEIAATLPVVGRTPR